MSRWFFGFLVALSFVAGCSWENKVKKLNEDEFKTYYALKPFMTDDQRKTYLTSKTSDERVAYLKSQNLWDMFYKYDEKTRQAIVDGAVQAGWTKDMVLMAWGAPYDKKKLTGRPAPWSEMLTYRFEKQEDGTVLVYVPNSKTAYKATERFTREVILDADVVSEIVEKAGWGQSE